MSSVPRVFDPSSAILIRGARVHNLQAIDLDVPRDRLVVFTGVSGSGKSSLAFDTIFAEGQRRYIECLSTYARQFLDQLERPDVDLIEGLPPTVAIDQKAGQASPRSTVGTITEIHDYLRLLFARLGTPFCPKCGLAIHRQTPEQMVAHVLGLPQGRKVILLAPLVRGRKGQHVEVFQAIRRAGLIRARVDGEIVEVTDEPPKLAKNKVHHVEAVVDRLVIREGIRPRLAESLNLALKLAEGVVVISAEAASGWEDQVLSVHLACPSCGTGLQPLQPRSFSFNSPYGACPACEGLGVFATSGLDSGRVPCPACDGSRLRPEARAVRVAGQIDRRGLVPPDHRRHDLLRKSDIRPGPAADRPASRPGDRQPAELPRAGRAGLPDPGTRLRHALRRRTAAGAAGDPARRGARRRLLRPGRADGRASSPRHRSAHRQPARAAGRGQQRDRRRARRGGDPGRRLGGRPRPRRRSRRRAGSSPPAGRSSSPLRRTRSRAGISATTFGNVPEPAAAWNDRPDGSASAMPRTTT